MLDRGFALVNTPPFFDSGELFRVRRKQTVLHLVGHRLEKFPGLTRYARWLERLLGEALPDESLLLTVLELRHEPAGYADKEVDRLHIDGSYLRSVYTLDGMPTIYRDGQAEIPVPRGHTLLMTAFDRARALRVHGTLHRRPGIGPERTAIVCSFVPCRNQPSPASAYPRVGRAQSARLVS